MPRLLVKTENQVLISIYSRNRKPGYELTVVAPQENLSSYFAQYADIHGIIVDIGLISPAQVRQLKEYTGEPTFPILLLAEDLSNEEAGMWLNSGVTDILHSSMPMPLAGRRIGAAVQLYCMSCSLQGQATDRLTGLNNRVAFYHFAKEMMDANPEDDYMVILSDIENFKRINERFGEEQGDALLRFIGGRLSAMNNENILFARYGGDQFVGILRRPNPRTEIDKNYLDQSMRFLYADAPIDHFFVQFGIYEDVDKALPVSIMCDRALMALKTIKHQYGRSFAKYTTQLQQRINREQQILDSMEQAIREKQLTVYYQPKHDTRTSAVVGAEALVRWNHPVYGFMSPADFIPLFERSGFITQMDAYVWGCVCEDLKALREQGMPVVPVSINVSRKDLAAEWFVTMLQDPVRRLNLPAELLHMELTESVYMEDAQILAPLMQKLRDAGIKIELDDFGSGFSSLGVLSKLPLDVVKLDISLIRNLENQTAIVESIISLMHTLGYETIAEGVENDRQVELLRKYGCDQLQGYYYSRPLTLNGFCEYLNENT